LVSGFDIAVNLMIGAVFGAVCSVLANGRGRSPVAWFFLGFFFGCISLIILLVIPDLKVAEQRRRGMQHENRRLREQVRKERMVSDARHGEHERRFAAHDRALGVDTTSPVPEQLGHDPQGSAGSAPPAAAAPGSASPAADHAATQWYFADHQGRQGPVSLSALRSLWIAGTVTGSSYVWCEGMGDWSTIAAVAGLEDQLGAG